MAASTRCHAYQAEQVAQDGVEEGMGRYIGHDGVRCTAWPRGRGGRCSGPRQSRQTVLWVGAMMGSTTKRPRPSAGSTVIGQRARQASRAACRPRAVSSSRPNPPCPPALARGVARLEDGAVHASLRAESRRSRWPGQAARGCRPAPWPSFPMAMRSQGCGGLVRCSEMKTMVRRGSIVT